MTASLDEMKKTSKFAAARDSKYFQNLMQEQVTNPHSRVYGMSYVQLAQQQRRIVLSTSDTFEKAQQISDALLRQEGIDLAFWTIEGYAHIDLPLTQEKPADVSSVTTDSVQKPPYSAYIMNLQLARDRFAADKQERVVLNNIIKRIKETNATRAK